MKILVIGSGGREHALVWAIARGSQSVEIYAHPGNAGILETARLAVMGGGSVVETADFADREGIDLVIIGPEQPLVDGLTDELQSRGIAVFGPSRAAARLEGSKVFAKEFMQRHGIPTAGSRIVDDPEAALSAIAGGELGYPLVVKAEGLAAGKGVIIAGDESEARQAVVDLMIDRKLGDAGSRLVIEECLVGDELSYLVLSDGRDYAPMPVARDHKRARDGDKGPNTGGMGAYSIPGLIDRDLELEIRRRIVEPTLAGASADGFPFRGVLYCGLMLTSDGPKVLEYNVRFGDPETQAILRRLESDFSDLAFSIARGDLAGTRPVWSMDSSTCVVLASQGYPGPYQTGKVISGLTEAGSLPGVVVFHAGTKRAADGQVITSGGRVLGVTAKARDLTEATRLAYQAVEKISFDGMQLRGDIGRK
ncbi:MAG: phosphoribosylamine--glycine ligase [Acidobacteriota bacterium]|nr:MAG: phosphoribosylamine--glycine ligase [Acidobacteriota bacterium]